MNDSKRENECREFSGKKSEPDCAFAIAEVVKLQDRSGYVVRCFSVIEGTRFCSDLHLDDRLPMAELLTKAVMGGVKKADVFQHLRRNPESRPVHAGDPE